MTIIDRIVRKAAYGIGKGPVLRLFRSTNLSLRKLSAFTHRQQLQVEWEIGPLPEWFDHNLDLYYQWRAQRNPLWLERGCFSSLALAGNPRLLELCCGDGFNSFHFY